MKTKLILAFAVLYCGSNAYAHSPLCDCFLNGDDTITCEGGFSDGSSAEGIAIRIVSEEGRVLLAGKMNGESQYAFDVPEEDFHVVFDAGENHAVTIYGGDIEE